MAVETDRGTISAPLVVDALGWRRVLAPEGEGYQPPDAPLSRGLEVHPTGAGEDLEVWIDRRYVPAGYGWSFPAEDELRIGIGSFDPRFHVKDTTVLLTEDKGKEPNEYQGNWIPHKLRRSTGDGVFFVGDSAGHCLPLTAEGIRTAFYFGIVLGRELRAVVGGERSSERAASRYAEFNDSHEWKFRWMLRAQRLLPRIPARLQRLVVRLCGGSASSTGPSATTCGSPPPTSPCFRPTASGRPPPSRSSPPQNRGRDGPARSDPETFPYPIGCRQGRQGRETDGFRLQGSHDVVICGASFAGLAAARELAGSGARVLVLDRYAIGERPTSACGIPTDWLRALDLIDIELPALRRARRPYPGRHDGARSALHLLDLRL